MNNIRVRLPRKLAKSVSSGVLAEVGRLNPVGAMGITLNMLPVHRVTMTLSEKDLALAMHDLVEVYNHKGSVGIYRVTKIPHTIGKNRKYELSHGLDVLSDATFDMIEEYKGTVDGMLAKIINAQTQMIGGVKYWRLGVCEDTNPWNKDIKYDNLMECLTEIAKKEEDYIFTFDQSTFPWTLNFVAKNNDVLSEFRLNRNTENCAITEDDTDLCTRLYLSVTSETNDDEGHGTYINEGYFTYNDTDAQNAGFGVVCKTAGVNQEDFTSQAALEAWVAAYFGRHNRPGIQITIDGVELNKLTGESIDEVHLARICRVALPEYSCTFNERIVSVNYPDALRKPLYVRTSLANKRQTSEDAFSEIKETANSASKSAGGAGRAAHNDATYFRRVIGDTANGLYSRIEQTAYYIRSEVSDTANGLYSRIEETASYIRAEVADTANGLTSKIEQTASYIRSEVSNTANGLSSKIEQTASYIRSEVSNTANGLSSKIEQTASSIRSEVRNTASGLSTRIEQNASAISLRVAKGDVGTQLAVELGNVTVSDGNLVVDGYITTQQLNAAKAEIEAATIQTLTSGTITAAGFSTTGNITASGAITGSGVYLSGGGSLANAISGIGTATESSGSISIPTTRVDGTQGPSINFNIAATQFYQDGVAAAIAEGESHFSPRYFKSESIAPIGKAYIPVHQTGTKRGDPRYFKQDNIAPIGKAYVPVKKTGTKIGSTPFTASQKTGTRIGTKRSGSWKYVYDQNKNYIGYFICFSVGKTEMYEAGNGFTYYDVGSSGTYYKAGDYFEYYDVGTATTLYEAGATVSRYELLNSATGATNTYYTSGDAYDYYDVGVNQTLYEADTTVTRYELLSSSEGATNTYYLKTV